MKLSLKTTILATIVTNFASASFSGSLLGTGTTNELYFNFGTKKSSDANDALDLFLQSGSQAPTLESDGAKITVQTKESPSVLLSKFYFKHGKVSYDMKVAGAGAGAGNVLTSAKVYTPSAGVALAVNGNSPNEVIPVLNGNYSASDTVDTGIDLSSGFHSYTFEWDNEKIVYLIDNKMIKTVYKSSLQDSANTYLNDPATLGLVVEKVEGQTAGIASASSSAQGAVLRSITLKDATGSYFYVQGKPDNFAMQATLMNGDKLVHNNTLDLQRFGKMSMLEGQKSSLQRVTTTLGSAIASLNTGV